MRKNDRISREFINNDYIITNGALELGRVGESMFLHLNSSVKSCQTDIAPATIVEQVAMRTSMVQLEVLVLLGGALAIGYLQMGGD